MEVKIKLAKPINILLNLLESTVKRSYRKVPIFGLHGDCHTSVGLMSYDFAEKPDTAVTTEDVTLNMCTVFLPTPDSTTVHR